jgi:hypothetical protein
MRYVILDVILNWSLRIVEFATVPVAVDFTKGVSSL